MNHTEKEKQKAAESVRLLVKSLKSLSDELNETEFEEFLEKEILPPMIKDEVVYSDSIWTKMSVVKIVYFDSSLENMGHGMGGAIGTMNTDSICWLLDHIYSVNMLLVETSKWNEMGFTKTTDYEWAVKSVRNDIKSLQGWLNGDVYERIQQYESEIEALRGLKETS